MAGIGSLRVGLWVLVLGCVSSLVSACGGDSDDGTNDEAKGGSGGSDGGGQAGQTGSDCQTLGCESGSYCAACRTPDDVAYVCLPKGSVC